MSKKIKEMTETAKSFEKIIYVDNEKSKKIAWFIATISSVIAVCSVTAVAMLSPLKTVELKVVSVDNTTGRAELITDIKQEKILQTEALGRYFVDRYIKLREGYNYSSLQSDYETIQIYSANSVKDAYLRLFESPQAPDKVYMNNSAGVIVDIISNIISDATVPDKLATLRFKKITRNFKTGQSYTEYWTARVTYRFNLQKSYSSAERDLNPLGFTVTSFDVAKEIRGE
ncbi:virB8 family protein [Xenorhabdus entomophaga]|uniref:virB8 family protein n=1 Tax=Xenorhabdus entomophaga TaxID=3136257 RepID=UPI0030F403E2